MYHSSGPRCGLLISLCTELPGQETKKVSKYWTSSVKLLDCKRLSTMSIDNHYLCEFPAAQRGNRLYSLETNFTISASGRRDVKPRWVSCPMGHLAHSFVACLAQSACWAQDDVAFGSDRDSWDIPSHTTCPAPLLPLPPSYACASGGDRVSYTFVCDHRRDCSDNSDESFCQHPPCEGSTPLQCGDVTQVSTNPGNMVVVRLCWRRTCNEGDHNRQLL